jgi:hypothetical protein
VKISNSEDLLLLIDHCVSIHLLLAAAGAADPNGKAQHSLRVTARLGDGLRHGHIDAVAPALSHQQAADVHAVTDKAL